MAELDVEAVKRSVVRSGATAVLVNDSDWAAIIAGLEDRDRLRAWMESDYLLAESFAEWVALEGRDG